MRSFIEDPTRSILGVIHVIVRVLPHLMHPFHLQGSFVFEFEQLHLENYLEVRNDGE